MLACTQDSSLLLVLLAIGEVKWKIGQITALVWSPVSPILFFALDTAAHSLGLLKLKLMMTSVRQLEAD